MKGNTLWLHHKAWVFRRIRGFFEKRGYTEVFTSPLIKHPNLDPNIGVFKVREDLYLHTSPEYPMKKLLAQERHSIYQLSPVFRDDHQDRLHHKSFLMLEWYGVGHTYLDLMEETQALIVELASHPKGGGPGLVRKRQSTIDLTPPWPRLTVDEAFRRWSGISIEEMRQEDLLKKAFEDKGLTYHQDDPWETHFNMLFVHCVEPHLRELKRPVFLYLYPEEVGLMAAPHRQDPSLVERVELFAGELELMNGYTELTDPEEQLKRWKRDGADPGRVDPELLEALPKMGQVAGAALGIERLLMLLWDLEDIAQVSLSE